jgi:alkylation response protein AidB-like acyl-CoA dehydrogenase
VSSTPYDRLHAEDLREAEIHREHNDWFREIGDDDITADRLREIGLLAIARKREIGGFIEPLFWRARMLMELDSLLFWVFVEVSAR